MMVAVGEQHVDLGTTEAWLSTATLVERRQHEGRMHYAFTTPDPTVRYRRPPLPSVVTGPGWRHRHGR
jgi:hypothetical protein